MTRRQQYVILGEVFPRKGDLRDRIRAILHSYLYGQTLSAEHQAFMLEVLQNHPDYLGKVRGGVEYITTRLNPVYGQPEFYLHRVDGTGTEFSFEKCLRPNSALQEFKRACRVAIADDIIEFKLRQFRENAALTCPFTGELLTLDTAHVDHAPPKTFDVIVHQFIDSLGFDVDTVAVTGNGEDGETCRYFTEDSFRVLWVNYHRREATLRVVSKIANLSYIKRGAV